MYDEMGRDLKEKHGAAPRLKIPLWGRAIQELLQEKAENPNKPLSVLWLQEKTGIHIKTLHNIVHGRIKNPDADKLAKIAHAFNISYVDLTARAVGIPAPTFFKYGDRERSFLDYPQHGFSLQLFTPPGFSFSKGIMRIKQLREVNTWQFPSGAQVCFYVYDGHIEFTYNGEKTAIGAHEGSSFEARFPHRFKNIDSRVEAKLFITICPSLF